MNDSTAHATPYSMPDAPSPFAPGEEQRWLLRYLPLVKRVVNQLSLQASQALDREDMEQIGLMGLLEGLRRYGIPDEQFARFAVLRIRGAILDELRRHDWRPRQVRQQAHKMRDATRELSRKLGRPPREDELRAHTGLDSAEYQNYLRAEAGEALVSLDELLLTGTLGSRGEVADFAKRVLDERLLSQALAGLSERERLVLTLYYQHDMNLREIGLVLEVSDARVCQLCKQAIDKAATFLLEK